MALQQHLDVYWIEEPTSPVRIRDGRYLAPASPGIGAELHAASAADHHYPDGPLWREERPS